MNWSNLVHVDYVNIAMVCLPISDASRSVVGRTV